MVQWLSLQASTAGSMDLNPGLGTKIMHPCGEEKNKKTKRQRKILLCSYVHRCKIFLKESFCQGSVIRVRFTFHKIILIKNKPTRCGFFPISVITYRQAMLYLFNISIRLLLIFKVMI